MAKRTQSVNLLEKALSLVGGKYDLLILDVMMQNRGRRRFNQLLQDIPALTPRMLSFRLKHLEQNGLVSKSLVLGGPVKTEYVTTPKAEELAPVLAKLKSWAKK